MLEPLLAGDVDFDDKLAASDLDDIARGIRLGSTSALWDVNLDSQVNDYDHRYWVHDLKQTWLGDANLENVFDSGDLVQVFQAGQYEDDIAQNTSWAERDWNGDGEFDTGDLVFAFQDGGYDQGLRKVVRAVPEPSSLWLAFPAVFLLLLPKQTQKRFRFRRITT